MKTNIIKLFSIFLFITSFSCSKNEAITENQNVLEYSFFIAGHTYGKPNVNNVGLHPPFKNKFGFINNQEKIELGVFTGDIVIYGNDQEWDEVDKDVALLSPDIYFAAGNHDVTNRELFELRYGETYKSFIQNDDLFIILDPNIDNWNISGNQLQFLKNTLQNNASNVNNIYVFFHQLLWWTPDNIYKNFTPNSFQGRAETINFWTEVEPLFNELPNKTFMFAGDVGAINNGNDFMYHNYDNITLIASGMGTELRDNFIIIDVAKNKEVSFRLIALNGDDINALGKLEDFQLP